MKHLICLVAFLGVLAGCTSETEAPAAGEEPATQALPSVSPQQAARVAEALRAAALDGNAAAVRQALDDGAGIDAADAEARTALMLASFNGYAEAVSLLLEHGADVAARDANSRTALMYASTGDFGDTVELLLEAGADPNAADDGEVWTPLMFAAGEGQMEVVQRLLDNDADPHAVAGDGDTAADHALTKGHDAVAEVLKQAAGTVSGG